MITSKSIWATDAFFLNDPQEVAWGRKALQTAYKRLDKAVQAELSRMLKALTRFSAEDGWEFDGLLRNRTYTVSFSTNGDALRQWRSYGGTRGGALGFNLKLLANVCPDALLAPVLYEPQEALADLLYHDLGTMLSDGERDQQASYELCDRLIERYATFLPLVKNPYYQDEEEWCLVIPGFQVNENIPKWRCGTNYATPHLTIGLWEGSVHTRLVDQYRAQSARERPIDQPAAYRGCRAVMGPEVHPLASQFFDKTLKGAVVKSKIKYRSP